MSLHVRAFCVLETALSDNEVSPTLAAERGAPRNGAPIEGPSRAGSMGVSLLVEIAREPISARRNKVKSKPTE